MELLVRLNGFLLIDSTILSQGGKLTIIEDSWNDGLGDDAMTSVVDDGRGEVAEAIDLQDLERL